MKSVLSVFVAACLLLSCGNNLSGSSDETVIRAGAILYEPDGKTPAIGATVKVFVASATGGKYASRQTTDNNGKYVLMGLSEGTYNIWAQRDSLVAFQSSVIILESITTLKNDTLQCPSTLTGIIGIKPQDDPRTVTGRFVGTDKRFTVDATGKFTMKGMAAGTYSLILSSTLPGYAPTPLEVAINPCSHDTLKDTVQLLYGE
jgi:hypothetical protein